MLNKNRIKVISVTKKDITRMDGARAYIGKSVVSKSGDNVGKVYDVSFMGNSMEGIIVSRRFSKIFIDKKFFATVSGKAIMLNINPVLMLLGKQVFDADGKKMGKVTKIVRKNDTNNFDALMVKKNIYTKAIKIPKIDVDVSKKNIILKKIY